MQDDIVLELQSLGKTYPAANGTKEVAALTELSLTVRRGEFLAVVGESGCGKSTLIDLIAGFIRPTSGSILANNREVISPGPDRIVVFQDHALFPWYTALDNVAYGLRRQGVAKARARAEAERALQKIGLGGFMRAYPATLSGGMRQRVALARSLVLSPDILLLDEPFAALDLRTREHLQDELLQMWEEYGWTIIFVTHGLTEAVYLADRVLVLQQGQEALLRSVSLPRPRKRQDKAVQKFSIHLSETMAEVESIG